MAGIKDVAEKAGVSTATVSRVLADKPYVRPELRQKVMAAVAELDYHPNLVARSLRSQQSNTIGLIVSDIRNPFFTAVSRAVEDVAYQHGYTVLLCNTDEDPHKEALYLRSMLAQNVSGVIFSPTRQLAKGYHKLNFPLPTVIIDRTVKDSRVDVVTIDNIDAAYRLTDHLIRNGCRHLAAISGEASFTGRERQKGFQLAMQDHSLAPLEMRLVGPFIESGYAAALELIDTYPQLDGFLATNSLLMAGVLKACRQHGKSIPDQIAVVGFDETVWTTLVQPAMTVIAQPTHEIGQTAMELLLRRIAEPDTPGRHVILQGELICRASSACQDG